MTLENLQYALYINNRILLNRIKDAVNGVVSTDVADIKKAINNINDVELVNIKKLISDLDTNFTKHESDTVVHVTQDDKDLWNAILDNAKKYAKELFDKVTSFKAVMVTELPTENIETMCIYLLAIDPKEKDSYEEYMYINNSWELIGNTRINLEPYILRTEVEKILEDYLLKKDSHKHDNLDVLDKMSEYDGLLNYKGKPIAQEIITDEDIEQAIKDILEILNKEES